MNSLKQSLILTFSRYATSHSDEPHPTSAKYTCASYLRHEKSSIVNNSAWDLTQYDALSFWDFCITQFSEAIDSAKHPFHIANVSTVTNNGSPQTRSVVLRQFNETLREFTFHTDLRSPKIKDLQHCKNLCLHWYDSSARVQIRLNALATTHNQNERARQAWHDSRDSSRACYGTPNPPGAHMDQFPPAPLIPKADDPKGFSQFVVVACHFEELEILTLHATGHQRVSLSVKHDPVSWSIIAP